MKILLYCTKAKPYLRDYRGKAIFNRFVISPSDRPFTSDDTQPILNGKIVAECDFEVEEIYLNNNVIMGTKTLNSYDLVVKSKVEIEQMRSYLKGNKGYAIHIKNLHIFDKPKELNFYMVYDKSYDNMFVWAFEEVEKYKPLTKAPQNMMRVWEDLESPRILISIRPEWLCKILNGEKTIEIRKKVLREMIK